MRCLVPGSIIILQKFQTPLCFSLYIYVFSRRCRLPSNGRGRERERGREGELACVSANGWPWFTKTNLHTTEQIRSSIQCTTATDSVCGVNMYEQIGYANNVQPAASNPECSNARRTTKRIILCDMKKEKEAINFQDFNYF